MPAPRAGTGLRKSCGDIHANDAVSALVLAAALAIAVLGEAAAAPPLDKPVKHCHYEANCVTKYRTCPPKPTAKPGGPPSTAQRGYALIAYIFAENKLIGETDVMNAETLPKVKMPNRDNFIIRFPDRI